MTKKIVIRIGPRAQGWTPDAGLELLCYVYAVPVIVVNGWEWFEEPEFMEKLVEIFGKREE